MKPKKLHPYYSYKKLWSYNAVINMVVGGRGLGKTYGAKCHGLRNAIKRGEEFIYLRRYKEELKAAKDTFFADMSSEFPEYEARINGNKGEWAPRITRKDSESDSDWAKRTKARKWTVACYFVALSVAQGQKSVAYPKVTLIIYDEFIIEDSTNVSYLRSEVNALLNFYSTVDRGQDKTRVLMLANSVTIMNPFFAEWGIEPDKLPEISTHHDGFIVAHFPDSREYAMSIYETRFGRFIKGTAFGDTAVDNKFKDAHDKLIEEKTANAKYKYTIETDNGAFSVWYDLSQGKFYILSRRPGNERILTMNPKDMDKGKIRVTYTEPVIRNLRYAFNRGDVVFDKPVSRNAFLPIFDRK